MPEKKENIVTVEFDPADPPPLAPEDLRLLEKLGEKPDSGIDYSDIPPFSDLAGFHKLRDLPALVKVDDDILDWIKTLGSDPEISVNRLLRKEMEAALGR